MEFQSLDRQVRSHVDPVEQAHAALDHELVHEALGKRREFHQASCQLSVFSYQFSVKISKREG